jgi:hypothetical protein
MFSKQFFMAYGEVLHAVAMADGDIQPEERDRLFDRIKQMLEPLEGADVYGFHALWYLDQALMPRSTADVLTTFTEVASQEAMRLTHVHAVALHDCLVETAQAYQGVEDSESVVIDEFRRAVQALVR